MFSKVNNLPTVCAIDLAFSGIMTPYSIDGYQPFYNSAPTQIDAEHTHFGKATVNFGEESDEAAAGTFYTQKLAIRFPSTDAQRSERLAKMNTVKYVRIYLSDGSALVMGRNDWEQNARIRVKVATNEKMGEVEFTSLSIFPTGFTPPGVGPNGLPVLFPINIINP